MANRYPLVVDTTNSNKIKEIPNGDNLLLTGNSITGVVNITASGNISAAGINMTGTLTYQGNPLANIATTSAYSDLTGVPTALSQFTNDENFRSNGDNVSVFTNDAGYLTSVAFADLTTTPTTLGGYGITDAASSVQGGLANSALQPGANISTLNNDSGFVTLTQLTSGAVTVDVNNSGDLVGSVFADDSTMLIDSILAAVNLDGTIRGHIRPNANQHNTWDLGTDTVRFKDAYFEGNIKTNATLAVEESYADAPTRKYFEVETGVGNNRIMRSGINMSTFGQSVAPEIDLRSYRASPADGDAGPEIVFRASTASSAGSVIATIETKVIATASGAETTEVSIHTDDTGTSVTPFKITGNTVYSASHISIADLKTLVAASTDFADYQTRIAAL